MFAGRFLGIKKAQKNAERRKNEERDEALLMARRCVWAIDKCKAGRIPWEDTCLKCGKCGRFER